MQNSVSPHQVKAWFHSTEQLIQDTIRSYSQNTLKKVAPILDETEQFPFQYLKELAETGKPDPA